MNLDPCSKLSHIVIPGNTPYRINQSYFVDDLYGNDLTGEFITTKATFPINGSIDGNQITFTTQISISMGEINAQISGEVTEEGFSGEAKVLFGKLPIQGTRKP